MPKPKNEPIFEEPEFSEENFLRYEKERAKSTIIVFLLAIGSGLLEGFLQVSGYYYLSMLLFIVLIVGLFRILGYMHLTLPAKGSHKFYLLMVFLLASILFWSIALNPPISVNTSPDLTLQYEHNGHWFVANQTNGQYVLLTGPANYSLRDIITFNANISFVKITGTSSAILGYHYHTNTRILNINLNDLGNLATAKLVTELRSGKRFFNETQTITFS
ncbi:MAG: hypothetical protein ACYCSO_02245 [Cuniculiplasma sp.]